MECGIHGCGIRDPPTRNPESTAWNPESKTLLDYLRWGENYHQMNCLRHLYAAKQAASTHQISCRYVALLNVFLATKYSAKIKKHCSRLEGRLPHTCEEVNNTFYGKNGKSYRDLQQSQLKLALRADKIVTFNYI